MLVVAAMGSNALSLAALVPPQSADAVATGGWDAILEREATSSAGFHAPEAELADGQVIPPIDLSAAGQHKARL